MAKTFKLIELEESDHLLVEIRAVHKMLRLVLSSLTENEGKYVTAFHWDKKVLTLEEALIYTGFKRSYMHNLTSTRQIPHSKPNGKMLFFDREKLDNWLLQNPVTTRDEIEQAAADYANANPLSKRKQQRS